MPHLAPNLYPLLDPLHENRHIRFPLLREVDRRE